MSEAQKIIKYIAIALAIFLTITIISTIIIIILSLSGFLGLTTNDNISKENMEIISTDTLNINELNIYLSFTNLEIKKGEEFRVETNNPKIEYDNKNGKVTIKENSSWKFDTSANNSVIIYIPDNIQTIQKAEIESGTGIVNIKNLKINELYFEQDAGKVLIDNLVVNRNASIESGAGKMEILSSSINNLDLDLGVGEFILNAKLTGNNEIDAGVGNMRVKLVDGLENYTIKASKGLGSIKIDNNEISNDINYGTGSTYINVNGGVGNITVD